MKQHEAAIFCAWTVCLMCVCVCWGDVKTPENRLVSGDVKTPENRLVSGDVKTPENRLVSGDVKTPENRLALDNVHFQGVSSVSGQNNTHDRDTVLKVNSSRTLNSILPPHSSLSTQAPRPSISSSGAPENERLRVNEPSLHHLSSTTEALPSTPSHTELSQDGMPSPGQNRNHDGDRSLHLSEDVSANSVLDIQSSHENAVNESDSGYEWQGVTASTSTFLNEITEASLYTTAAGVPASQKTRSQDPADTTKHDPTICDNSDGGIKHLHEEYSVVNDTHKITVIPHHTIVSVNVTDIDEGEGFLILQAHSQNHYLILSDQVAPHKDCYTNSTDPGLVLWHDAWSNSLQVFITNCHNTNITVLFMVHHYTNRDPIPGKYKAPCVPLPFLVMDPNILTTEVSYQAAAMAGWDSEDVVGALRYEVFLTYMYARDLSEEKYWDTLVATSSLQGLKENGKSVLVRENNDTAEELDVWLVSYSGVGAVVTVVVSYNGSNGTLYSSGVSYGCNFIDAEKYRCTKLVTSLAKLFCASLLFIGAIMLFLGHRWLNFTMFISGFLFSWCMLFLVFAQSTHSTINGLGWGTLVGAVLGGALWLVGWHRFRRPFHSSLLIIIMAVLFVGMMATYFLRFAISPTTSNLSAFVVFPVFFAIVIVAYSIIDIKKVHIFSCTLLGSYAFIVPFAFYFGSSLTYIVINVLGLVTVQHYAETVGYPPFQVCDIILLCLWVGLFGGGMAYQLYRERASPPFHPPNLTSWHDFKKSVNFVFDKMFACLPMDPDPGGMDVEDRPAWLLRVVYTSKLAWRRLTCRGGDIPQSGYESFPRIRRLSQYNDQDSNTSDSRMAMILSRIKAWKGRVWLYFRRGNERVSQDSDDEEQQGGEVEGEEDESQLLEGTASCCAFRNTHVVLDDAYTTNTQPQG